MCAAIREEKNIWVLARSGMRFRRCEIESLKYVCYFCFHFCDSYGVIFKIVTDRDFLNIQYIFDLEPFDHEF